MESTIAELKLRIEALENKETNNKKEKSTKTKVKREPTEKQKEYRKQFNETYKKVKNENPKLKQTELFKKTIQSMKEKKT